jgi:UDP-glucose 6-dehydrogenase
VLVGLRINLLRKNHFGQISRSNLLNRTAIRLIAMENTVRDVNIAFVNELTKISDVLNLDAVDIIDGMSPNHLENDRFTQVPVWEVIVLP